MSNQNPNKVYRIDEDWRGKGRALVATSAIACGSVIIHEPHILSLKAPRGVDLKTFLEGNQVWYENVLADEVLNRLPAAERAAFLRLSFQEKPDHKMFWRMKTNCFGWEGQGNGGAWLIAYDEISAANHSCSPNAIVALDGETLLGRLRALKDIHEGEEIVIDYACMLNPHQQRQYLIDVYGFLCVCEICCHSGAVMDRLTVRDLHDTLKIDECQKLGGVHCIPRQGEEEGLMQKSGQYVTALQRLGIRDTRYACALLRKAQLQWIFFKRTYKDTSDDYHVFLEGQAAMQQAMRINENCVGTENNFLSMDDMRPSGDEKFFREISSRV
ncbi:SET domain-containing protein [Rhizodiscina lignyota]|uniref:SET domain-containing protein n=1 Tax=Rhizodiscina lignyota TaxID=1504668 RepID=A0A9P4IE40_9PEZI|nr:SET domain-containing protein [Rhizodiscina lignyota]